MNDFLQWFLDKHYIISTFLMPEVALAWAMWVHWHFWCIVCSLLILMKHVRSK